MNGVFTSCKEEQWRDLQKWMNELRKVAQVEERRLEARELRRQNPKPVLQVAGCGVSTKLMLGRFIGAREKPRFTSVKNLAVLLNLLHFTHPQLRAVRHCGRRIYSVVLDEDHRHRHEKGVPMLE